MDKTGKKILVQRLATTHETALILEGIGNAFRIQCVACTSFTWLLL